MADKRRRRTERAGRRPNRPPRVQLHAARVGPGVTTAPLGDVLNALTAAPDARDWEAVSRLIVPMFPRRRPLPFDAPEPVRLQLPPGVLVNFGIDLGPAFAYVMPEVLEGWPVTLEGVALVALGNLRDLLRDARPGTLLDAEFDGIPLRILQTGHGVASTTVLLPDELRRIFGTTAQRFIAPSRDLLISLPLASNPDAAADLVAGIEGLDPNVPAVESFVLDAAGLRCEALTIGAGVA